ncbi:MAG: efflux RND transporter periplasmic adaptor subunit [Deltaproteobacteria bacterium]|nr:efflux RND transporter periplasmic adaptor subunit [Candidatus Anaeroferrophillus wilburensis]MBN2890199.1 efflux RND transporter periplasmic adaptor subunit [Deltaproteobacteria bacterium]
MNTTEMAGSADLKKTLGLEPSAGRNKHLNRLLVWGVLLVVVIVVSLRWITGRNDQAIEYQTVAAQRGDFTVTVTATGNLQPTNQVDVGSEVSGTIASVAVDYNDVVKAGQVLARIDTTKLEAQANQSRAAVASSRANLHQAQASLFEAEKELERLARTRELSGGRIPSVHDFDAAEAVLKRARASEAMIRANIAEAEARLRVDQTNLEKAIIVSPINGVVLKRSVEPGQTVAASLQAPVLFTLAEDLTKMELHVDVDEADVGQVREGQQGTFMVDAYPDRTFPAHIVQVRYGSQSSEGVVTYLTVLNVDNSDLSLRPGMTATADIVVRQVTDALLVPNAALRYLPPQPEVKSAAKAGGSLLSKLFPRPARTGPRKSAESTGRKTQRVWTLRDNQPVAVPVTTGATNGVMTEIISGDISPDMPLILESVSKRK